MNKSPLMVRVDEPSETLIKAIENGDVVGEVYADGDVYVDLESLPPEWKQFYAKD